jgi:hypothetical protein
VASDGLTWMTRSFFKVDEKENWPELNRLTS